MEPKYLAFRFGDCTPLAHPLTFGDWIPRLLMCLFPFLYISSALSPFFRLTKTEFTMHQLRIVVQVLLGEDLPEEDLEYLRRNLRPLDPLGHPPKKNSWVGSHSLNKREKMGWFGS